MMTSAPFSLNFLAVAWPIVPVPPVIKTTFPVSSFFGLFSLVNFHIYIKYIFFTDTFKF